MGVRGSVAGMVVAQIDSGDIPALLSAIGEMGIPVFDVHMKGELTLLLRIQRKDWRSLEALCSRRGEKADIHSRLGLYWTIKDLLHRPVLLCGILVLLCLARFLPQRVLFFRVEGNQRVPAARILEAAEDSGLYFGATRREVRSERMKNALMDAVPELQWAGINTYGCLAVISVRERATQPRKPAEIGGVGSIVAACDGIVISATANRGSCLCRPGQAVTKGEVLISGYSDLGLAITGIQADGEVFAQTRRQFRAVTPLGMLIRGDVEGRIVKFSLRIGKKRINLWKGSGISEGSCGRMYEEYYITLPGGFQLPIALIKETITLYEIQTGNVDALEAQTELEQFGREYIRTQMLSGTVISEALAYREESGLLSMEGEYRCAEMIGRLRQEKIGE